MFKTWNLAVGQALAAAFVGVCAHFALPCLAFTAPVLASAKATEWQPYDLSILYPVNGQVPVEQSGLCHLPKLSLLSVAGKPLLPKRYFHRIVDEAFGLESIIAPPNSNEGNGLPHAKIRALQFAQHVDVAGGQKTRKEQLAKVRGAFASGDYPQPLLCGLAHNASGLDKVSDAIVLAAGGHLAQLRRYPAALCDYDNWRVTAVRFDLCMEQAEIGDLPSGETGLPGECLTQEFRVTIKPAYSVAERLSMPNVAIKLVYYLGPGADNQLVADLRQLRDITRKVAGGSADGTLKPHPGLQAQMTSCGASPVAKQVETLISRYGLIGNLVAARYSGANRDLDRVSMGMVPFYQARPHTTAGLDQVVSFSLRHLRKDTDQRPFSANLGPGQNQVVMGFAKPFRHSPKKLADPSALTVGRDLIAKGNKIANPLLISQFPLKPDSHGTDCLSCHMNEAAQQSIKASAVDEMQVASHAFRYYTKEGTRLKMWEDLEPKAVGQVENFGYYYDPRTGKISYKIAERTVHETDNQVRLILKYF